MSGRADPGWLGVLFILLLPPVWTAAVLAVGSHPGPVHAALGKLMAPADWAWVCGSLGYLGVLAWLSGSRRVLRAFALLLSTYYSLLAGLMAAAAMSWLGVEVYLALAATSYQLLWRL